MRWIIGFADFFSSNFRSSAAIGLIILFYFSHTNCFETVIECVAEGEISFFVASSSNWLLHCGIKFETIVDFYYCSVAIGGTILCVRLTNKKQIHSARGIDACSVHTEMSEIHFILIHANLNFSKSYGSAQNYKKINKNNQT